MEYFSTPNPCTNQQLGLFFIQEYHMASSRNLFYSGRLNHKGEIVKYLHTMVRVIDIEESIDFYCNKLGLKELNRHDNEAGRFTLVFLGAEDNPDSQIELTHNWDPEAYDGGRNFGHLAYGVDNIYATCEHLMNNGVAINRPPRDGQMAFVRSPDNISIEILQNGQALPPTEPWASMPNTGEW